MQSSVGLEPSNCNNKRQIKIVRNVPMKDYIYENEV
jgi:hypothetical protein